MGVGREKETGKTRKKIHDSTRYARDGKEWYVGQVEVRLRRTAADKVGGFLTMKLSDPTNELSFPLKKDMKSLSRRKGSQRFRGAWKCVKWPLWLMEEDLMRETRHCNEGHLNLGSRTQGSKKKNYQKKIYQMTIISLKEVK